MNTQPIVCQDSVLMVVHRKKHLDRKWNLKANWLKSEKKTRLAKTTWCPCSCWWWSLLLLFFLLFPFSLMNFSKWYSTPNFDWNQLVTKKMFGVFHTCSIHIFIQGSWPCSNGKDVNLKTEKNATTSMTIVAAIKTRYWNIKTSGCIKWMFGFNIKFNTAKQSCERGTASRTMGNIFHSYTKKPTPFANHPCFSFLWGKGGSC